MSKYRFSEFLTEAPLPDDWDRAMYNERIPFTRRVQYAKERAKRLGSGSSRIAFVIPYQGRDTVLKIAKNNKGMAQNEVEASTLDDYIMREIGIMIPLIDYDEENDRPTWIHTEFASKAKDSDFVKACGGTLQQLVSYGRKFRGEKSWIDTSSIDEESELVQRFTDYIGNYNPNLNDYIDIRNWGIYNGKLVIIDAGFNDDVSKLYFK